MSFKSVVIVGALAMSLGLTTSVMADLSLTYNIFEDSPPPVNQSGLALSVFVSSPVSGQIEFRFRNDSTGINAGAVVTSLHFENVPFAANLSFNSIVGNSSSPLVNFGSGSLGSNLFGGNNINWMGNFFFAERTNGSGGVSRGLNTGEQIMIRFNLLNGATLAQVEQNLVGSTGRMRLASHVQSLEAGQSVSVTYVVPSPGAASLVGLGLLLAGRRRRA